MLSRFCRPLSSVRPQIASVAIRKTASSAGKRTSGLIFTKLSKSFANFGHKAKTFSSTAEGMSLEAYTDPMKWMHFAVGVGAVATVGLVVACQELYPAWKDCSKEQKKAKQNLMFLHKSMGLLTAALVVPRIGVRLASKMPAALPGLTTIEHIAGYTSHSLMYVFMIVMPATGVAMGYYGGNGLPFFFTTLTPASGKIGKAKDKKLAGQSYGIHKQMGQVFKYFIPVHVGAGFFHRFQLGAKYVKRMSPF